MRNNNDTSVSFMSNIQSFLLSCQNVTVKFIKTVHFHYLYFIWRFYIVTPISNCNGTWSTSNTQALACSDNAPRSPFDPSLSAKMKRCGAFVKNMQTCMILLHPFTFTQVRFTCILLFPFIFSLTGDDARR